LDFLDKHFGQWPELLDRRWEVLRGGLRSLNLRSGDLVARIALVSEHNLRKEAALLHCFRPHVRVPEVMEVGEETLLLEYIPVCDLPASEHAGFSVGETAAAIHSQGYEQAGFLNEQLEVDTPFASAICGLEEWMEQVKTRQSNCSDPTIREAHLLWKGNVDRLKETSVHPVLVHSDFKPANVKWSPTENCVVVFDWEFAWAGPNLFDIGQMFRWNPPGDFVRSFEEGYRAKGGFLHAGWLRDAELFDLLNLLDVLSREPRDPTRDGDVRNRIAETLDRYK